MPKMRGKIFKGGVQSIKQTNKRDTVLDYFQPTSKIVSQEDWDCQKLLVLECTDELNLCKL